MGIVQNSCKFIGFDPLQMLTIV